MILGYNTNLTTYDVDAPILHQEGIHFSGLSDIKHYFKHLPGESNHYTFYLCNEVIEALRLLSFYDNENISELAGSLLCQKIQERATTIGHPNIFEKARARFLRKKQAANGNSR